MPDFNPQEDDGYKSDFQRWKKNWEKTYATPDEEDAGFENFKENLRRQTIPSSEPLWNVLNQYADQPRTEHFEYLRLDYFELDDDSDEDLPDGPILFYTPVKQEDGTIDWQYLPPEDYRREVDATAKHQSTVPPVKRSSDDKDDTKEEDDQDDGTVKRQKIGCGGQKQGCCSDSGK